MSPRKTLAILLLLFAAISLNLSAAEISGTVSDSQTGQPLPGVYIKLAGSDIGAVSDNIGAFRFETNQTGDIKLVASAMGYEVAVKRATAGTTANFGLVPKILRGQDIVVTADRARKGETPAAFSNMTNDDINKQYWMQDVPILLTSLPNVFAYSDAGSGIGYSYMKMRGFDQKRISVMLNGVPLNDADSHEVFWVDLPDFPSNVDDIQVQRGVGSSLYGASALGGSVNLVTGGLSNTPKLNFESGVGSYNTRKLSISGSSGLVNDNYVFYGRYSKVETDGYRDNSWTKSYAYFIGLARYDENMSWKFNTYGGPEESHLAYKGVTKEQMDSDRKFNELTYSGELDHFNQPHYELIHDWKMSDSWSLSNTFYYFSGKGYYTQKRDDQYIEEFFPGHTGIDVTDSTLAPRDYYALDDSGAFVVTDGHYTITKVDLIKQPTVKEYDWGWNPRATWSRGPSALTLGSELRIHQAHHFGDMTWSSVFPVGLDSDVHYYDYHGRSRTAAAYLLETYRLNEKLTLMANVQYQYHYYKLYDDKRFDVGFKKSFDFVSPRAGINYTLNQNIGLFASISTSSRHPAFKDIYDPTDYWSNPSLKPDNFRPIGAGWGYIGKEVKPEKLLDFELGGDFKFDAGSIPISGSLNLYRMQITDEILPYAGQIDDMGYPISGNADKTLHQGVEFSADATLTKTLSIGGNVSVNDDHFVKHKEYGFDYDNWVALEYDRSDKRIGGFPNAIANYHADWNIRGLLLGLNGNYIGTQYIDNGETYKLDSFNLLGSTIAYDLGRLLGFRSLLATVRINNLANVKYAAAAYIDYDDGLPRYMVGAEKNFYLSLKASF